MAFKGKVVNKEFPSKVIRAGCITQQLTVKGTVVNRVSTVIRAGCITQLSTIFKFTELTWHTLFLRKHMPTKK